MKKDQFVPFEKFIPQVLRSTGCKTHDRIFGEPCYVIETARGQFLDGICGKRARAAGMDGEISMQSLSQSYGGRRNGMPLNKSQN